MPALSTHNKTTAHLSFTEVWWVAHRLVQTLSPDFSCSPRETLDWKSYNQPYYGGSDATLEEGRWGWSLSTRWEYYGPAEVIELSEWIYQARGLSEGSAFTLKQNNAKGEPRVDFTLTFEAGAAQSEALAKAWEELLASWAAPL